MNNGEHESRMQLASGIAAFEAKNFAQAMALLRPLAMDGEAEAQYRLAIMLQNGLGAVRNEAQAAKWMQLAAEQGFALAQHGLGVMYLHGDCLAADVDRAKEWLTRAAEQGLEGARAVLQGL